MTPGPTVTLPDATTDPQPIAVSSATSATVTAFNADGDPTTDMLFRMGFRQLHMVTKPICEGGRGLDRVDTGDAVSAGTDWAQKGTIYHYRLVACQSNRERSRGWTECSALDAADVLATNM